MNKSIKLKQISSGHCYGCGFRLKGRNTYVMWTVLLRVLMNFSPGVSPLPRGFTATQTPYTERLRRFKNRAGFEIT